MRSISLLVHDDFVLARDELQALEHAVEVVHDTGRVSIDKNQRFARRDLKPKAAESVVRKHTRADGIADRVCVGYGYGNHWS